MDDLDMESFELTGLYDGTPLTQKSSFDQPEGPDTVWLFRRPILDEWAERGNVTLTELVAHVTIQNLRIISAGPTRTLPALMHGGNSRAAPDAVNCHCIAPPDMHSAPRNQTRVACAIS